MPEYTRAERSEVRDDERAKRSAVRDDEDDDGRVIAPMNVEGMPWYTTKTTNSKTYEGAAPLHLSRREKLAYSFGVLKAALLVTLVFVAVLLAFILFCTEVWFR